MPGNLIPPILLLGDLLHQRMERTLNIQRCSKYEWEVLASKLGKDG